MTVDADGVDQDDLRAFDNFNRLVNEHANDSPSSPQAQNVANAYVALGRYYLTGIPKSKIKADRERARNMFSYAATYYGNADAQYELARLYLNTPEASSDTFTLGARWLKAFGGEGPA
jgi:TPR repeat protein